MLDIHAKSLFLAARLLPKDGQGSTTAQHFVPTRRKEEFVRLNANALTTH